MYNQTKDVFRKWTDHTMTGKRKDKIITVYQYYATPNTND